MLQARPPVYGRHFHYCSKCEHGIVNRRSCVPVCPMCGHKTTDTTVYPIRYHWSRRSCGYSRLFPPEDIKKAMRSVYVARRQGVSFKLQRTFAGLRVTVTSLPLRKKVKDLEY